MKRPAKSKYKTDTRIKKRKLAFYDLEFSGLDLNQEIIEIGCLLVSQPDLKIVKEWKVMVKPKHLESADMNSLRIVGYSDRKWHNAVPLKEALVKFNKIARNTVLVGYNSVWDFMFLKKAYYDCGLETTFHWQCLDVLSMAYALLGKENLKGYRMTEVAKFLGLEMKRWHDPLEDSRLTYKMYKKLLEYKNQKLKDGEN